MTDIVIVGGGVIGCSIAYHLARRGQTSVTLLERGTVGSGETRKSGGFVQTMWPNLGEVKMIAWSREFFARTPETGWVGGGYLQVTGAGREPAVREVMDAVTGLGLPCTWLDREGVAKVQPSLHTDDLVGGAYESASGWASPIATTKWFAAQARALGVTIREGVTVTGLMYGKDEISGVATTEDVVQARVVVLAMGPWTSFLSPAPIKVLRGQAVLMDRTPVGSVGFYDEETGLYTHPDGDVNLVGIDWPFEPVADPAHYSRDLDPAYLAALQAKLAYRFPDLADSKVAQPIVGLYDFTKDGQPIVDAGETRGLYIAAGFSGIGFKSSPATGLAMAELILDGHASTIDIDHLKRDRFDRSLSDVDSTAMLNLLQGRTQAALALLGDEERRCFFATLTTGGAERLGSAGSAILNLSASQLASLLRSWL